MLLSYVFFFQAEDGIRDLVRSRGLGDVYKRQIHGWVELLDERTLVVLDDDVQLIDVSVPTAPVLTLSLIHI